MIATPCPFSAMDRRACGVRLSNAMLGSTLGLTIKDLLGAFVGGTAAGNAAAKGEGSVRLPSLPGRVELGDEVHVKLPDVEVQGPNVTVAGEPVS